MLEDQFLTWSKSAKRSSILTCSESKNSHRFLTCPKYQNDYQSEAVIQGAVTIQEAIIEYTAIQEATIQEVIKTFFFVYDIKMSSQLLEELKLKAKNRSIKGYENMPINKLLSIL